MFRIKKTLVLVLLLAFFCFKNSFAQSNEIIDREIDKVINNKKGCLSYDGLFFVYVLDLNPVFSEYYHQWGGDGRIHYLTDKIGKRLRKKGYSFSNISAECEKFRNHHQTLAFFKKGKDRKDNDKIDDIIAKTNNELADIRQNSRNRTPREALTLYPQHREYIKGYYKDWCEGFNNCEEYLAAFPEQKYDSEISKNQERRRAASGMLVNYGNKVVEGVKEMPKNISSSSSSSNSDIDENYENIIAPTHTETEWKETSSPLDGTYYYSTIRFPDGKFGDLNKGKKSGNYFFEANLGNNYYYNDKSSTINALYIYLKHGKIIKKNYCLQCDH